MSPYTGGFPRGTDIDMIRGRYDFAVDGGAASTIIIGAEKVPAGRVILGGFVEVDTPLTSGGAATVAVQVESAGDIVAAAAFDGAPWSSAGLKSVIPAFTGATMVKTTAARDLKIVIAAAALTAGVFDVLLFFTDMGD